MQFQKEKSKALKPRSFKAFRMAGAVRFELTARGFGVAVRIFPKCFANGSVKAFITIFLKDRIFLMLY